MRIGTSCWEWDWGRRPWAGRHGKRESLYHKAYTHFISGSSGSIESNIRHWPPLTGRRRRTAKAPRNRRPSQGDVHYTKYPFGLIRSTCCTRTFDQSPERPVGAGAPFGTSKARTVRISSRAGSLGWVRTARQPDSWG